MICKKAAVALTVFLCLFLGALPVRADEPGLYVPRELEITDCGSAACGLGSAAADALRAESGSDLAIVNSGDLVSGLSKGDHQAQDIFNVFATQREAAIAHITPYELWQILEAAVSGIVVEMPREVIDRDASNTGAFAQISGFSFRYDASAQPGSRVLSVCRDNGEELEREDRVSELTLAASAFMLDGGYGYPPVSSYERLDISLGEAMVQFLGHGGLDSERSQEKRITVIGANENLLIDRVESWVPGAGVAVLMGIAVLFRRPNTRFSSENGDYFYSMRYSMRKGKRVDI